MAWTMETEWPHGRVWVDGKGERTYHVRERRAIEGGGSKQFAVSTRCHDLRSAMREYARFSADPEAYRPLGVFVSAGVPLIDKLIEEYLLWADGSQGARRSTLGGGGTTGDERWLSAKRRYLKWWQSRLGSADLKRLPLSRIHELLAGAPGQRDRAVTIKHLYSFLRTMDRIATAEDPTYGKLKVAPGRSAQDAKGSKVIEDGAFQAVLPLLPEAVRDACILMAGTGIHVSEVERFVASGKVELREGRPAVFIVKHKGGHDHRVEVPGHVAEAALRLKGAKKLPSRNVVYRLIKKACEKASVEPWTPGRFRATFATRAVEAGASPASVALALGHRSAATTLRWYSTTAVAPMVESGGLKPRT